MHLHAGRSEACASVWCFGVVVRGGVQLCIKKTAGEAIGSEPARSGGKIGFVAAVPRTIDDKRYRDRVTYRIAVRPARARVREKVARDRNRAAAPVIFIFYLYAAGAPYDLHGTDAYDRLEGGVPPGPPGAGRISISHMCGSCCESVEVSLCRCLSAESSSSPTSPPCGECRRVHNFQVG